MRNRLALPARPFLPPRQPKPTRAPMLVGAVTLNLFVASAGLGLEYGGLTFYESTPDDVKTIKGDFRGCQSDSPDSPNPLNEVTHCSVVLNTGSTPEASLQQDFVFKRGVLQAVKVTASDAATYEAFVANVSKRYADMKPTVLVYNRTRLRVLIADQKAAREAGQISAPKLVSRVEPEYPASERKARVEGVVIVEGIVTAEGTLEDIRVLHHLNPVLDDSAVHAIKQWKYEPAKLDGDPVRVYLTVTATYSLRGNRPGHPLSAVGTATPGGVLVTCNVPCSVWIDGEMKAILQDNHGTFVKARPGKHNLIIKSVENPADHEQASVVVGE